VMATADEIVDEAKRARKVTHIVDIATVLIRQSRMSRGDAEILVARTFANRSCVSSPVASKPTKSFIHGALDD